MLRHDNKWLRRSLRVFGGRSGLAVSPMKLPAGSWLKDITWFGAEGVWRGAVAIWLVPNHILPLTCSTSFQTALISLTSWPAFDFITGLSFDNLNYFRINMFVIILCSIIHEREVTNVLYAETAVSWALGICCCIWPAESLPLETIT